MPATPLPVDPLDDLPEAVREAEAAVAELTESFRAWAGDSLVEARRELARARAEPAGGPAAARAIFDIAHNLKGQGGSFRYDLVSEIAAGLCDYVTDARGPLAPVALDVVEIHLAAIGFVLERRIEGAGGEMQVLLLGKLRQLVAVAGPPGAG